MTAYADTLAFLYSQLPMYQRTGSQAFKKGLGNIRSLLKYLDNPERKFQAIHVAGTNGKGTVSHMLAACYQASGKQVGLYTSPHYTDFRERVRISGFMVSKKEVSHFVEKLQPFLKEVKPSFFEITVALAFDAFARHNVDLAIVETGLGGRLDSTNVLKPLVSVITNISFDHIQMLGNTLPAIAREKAGIIKRNVPVVVGTYQRETAKVFQEKAAAMGSTLSFACQSLSAELLEESWTYQDYEVRRNREIFFDNLRLGCSGPYQKQNLVTALHTISVAGEQADLVVAPGDIGRGMRDIRTLTAYQGRWQMLSEQPIVLCDSAHNQAGLDAVLTALRKYPSANLHFVLGFVDDKDVHEILSSFPKDAQYYFARPGVPRGLEVDKVLSVSNQIGLNGIGYRTVRIALSIAKRKAAVEDLIYVGGSTFVVAEVI